MERIRQGLPVVTVHEAFRTAFDALMRATGRTASDMAEEIGVSQATFTKLRKGQRGASFDMLERMRLAFGVTACDLFDPDRALQAIGLVRTEARQYQGIPAHGVDEPRTPVVMSSPHAQAPGKGADMLGHKDPELLAALLAFWDGISPEGRLELVGLGHRLRTAATAADTGASADFKAG